MSQVTEKSTKEKMTMTLNEFVKCGVIGLACDRAGVSRAQHTKWLETYPQYKELYETVRERFTDGLEAVAIERAKERYKEIVSKVAPQQQQKPPSSNNIPPANPSTQSFDNSQVNVNNLSSLNLFSAEGRAEYERMRKQLGMK